MRYEMHCIANGESIWHVSDTSVSSVHSFAITHCAYCVALKVFDVLQANDLRSIDFIGVQYRRKVSAKNSLHGGN